MDIRATVAEIERKIVRHCAPTLAGIKPANLFVCRIEDPRETLLEAHATADEFDLAIQTHALNICTRTLHAAGVSIQVLAQRSRGPLLYVYRPALLENCLTETRVTSFLADYGYETNKLDACLAHLSQRIAQTASEHPRKHSCAFPHEIGLFLGYPLDDVVGFIENEGENFLCCGCWKVYTRRRDAEACFCRYKRCSRYYEELFAHGISLASLAHLNTQPAA